LCRPWQKRVKGRDWYDLIWYVSRDVPVNLSHLRDRLSQSNALNKKTLALNDLLELLTDKINDTDFENAKSDILPFISDKDAITIWSRAFFIEVIKNIRTNKS